MSFASIIAEVQASQATESEKQRKAADEREARRQQEFEETITFILQNTFAIEPQRYEHIPGPHGVLRRIAWVEKIGFGFTGENHSPQAYVCVRCETCGQIVYSDTVSNLGSHYQDSRSQDYYTKKAKEYLVNALTKHPVEWGKNIVDGSVYTKHVPHKDTCNQRWVMIDQRSGAVAELGPYGESEESALKMAIRRAGYVVERRIR
jgi:hypothetical protein